MARRASRWTVWSRSCGGWGLEDETQPQPRLVVTEGNLPADLRVTLMAPRPAG